MLIQNLKINSKTFLTSNLIISWTPFGIKFQYISWLPENWCFGTRIMRHACFYFQNPFILVSDFNQDEVLFRVSFLDTIFQSSFQHDATEYELPKMAFQIGQVAPRRKKRKHEIATSFGILEPTLFPNRFWLFLFCVICCRSMIDVGSSFCKCVRFATFFLTGSCKCFLLILVRL